MYPEMVDEEKIKKEGVKLLEEFSEKLKDIPETGETHYVVDINNVFRQDAPGKKREGFREKIGKNAPKMQEGYIVAEKGR